MSTTFRYCAENPVVYRDVPFNAVYAQSRGAATLADLKAEEIDGLEAGNEVSVGLAATKP